jgi:hypothetical protein
MREGIVPHGMHVHSSSTYTSRINIHSFPLLLRCPSAYDGGNSPPSIVPPFDKFGFVVYASAHLELDNVLLKEAADASILYRKIMSYYYNSLLRTCIQGLLAA